MQHIHDTMYLTQLSGGIDFNLLFNLTTLGIPLGYPGVRFNRFTNSHMTYEDPSYVWKETLGSNEDRASYQSRQHYNLRMSITISEMNLGLP